MGLNEMLNNHIKSVEVGYATFGTIQTLTLLCNLKIGSLQPLDYTRVTHSCPHKPSGSNVENNQVPA